MLIGLAKQRLRLLARSIDVGRFFAFEHAYDRAAVGHEPSGSLGTRILACRRGIHAMRLSIFISVPELTENRSIKLNTGVSLRDRRNSVVLLYRIFIPASGPRG